MYGRVYKFTLMSSLPHLHTPEVRNRVRVVLSLAFLNLIEEDYKCKQYVIIVMHYVF
jgi:hypothetical protein